MKKIYTPNNLNYTDAYILGPQVNDCHTQCDDDASDPDYIV